MRVAVLRKIALSFARPRRLFDAVRHEASLKPAFWFVLVLTTLYNGAYNILYWYRQDTPDSSRNWRGVAIAARDWLMVWIPEWPLMIFASILVVTLCFVVAALVALVVGLFGADISYRQVFQGLAYSCPPAFTLALLATLLSVWAPTSSVAAGLFANAWYVALVTIALSTFTRTSWPRVVVPALVGGVWW